MTFLRTWIVNTEWRDRFFYLTLYILRIFTTGFLDGHQANGAFVACGPPGFTALALLKLGESAMKMFVRIRLT